MTAKELAKRLLSKKCRGRNVRIVLASDVDAEGSSLKLARVAEVLVVRLAPKPGQRRGRRVVAILGESHARPSAKLAHGQRWRRA